MWLVLCNSDDLPALWAYQGLKQRGLVPLEIISAEMLAYSLQWEHRLGNEDASVSFTLGDGRVIQSNQVRGVLNRILSVPTEHLSLAGRADQEYAAQELTAFFMSWIYALSSPVLNYPTSQGLSGQWRHISEWLWLAGRAGLPTLTYRQNSYNTVNPLSTQDQHFPSGTPVNTVFVVDEQVIGISNSLQAGCKRLAELAKTPLLGIDLVRDMAGNWYFSGASPVPDLRLGGGQLLDTLMSILQGKSPQ